MEFLIGLLGLGLVVIVVFFLKFSGDEAKREKNIESAKDKRLAELDAEVLRKDGEMKKMMEERQKLEDEFFKTRDEIDILKKENTEISARLKLQEKLKDDLAELKNEIKQKDAMVHQETVTRQRLQGEISLKELEREKLQNALEAAKAELKSKTEMYEGLKSQFEELESEVQRAGEENLKKQRSEEKGPAHATAGSPSTPAPESQDGMKRKDEVEGTQGAPAAEIPAQPVTETEQPKEGAPQPKPSQPSVEKNDSNPPALQAESKPQASGPDEMPGFSGASGTKIKLGGGAPSDTDFLASPLQSPADVKDPQDAPFKFTNINKPTPSQKDTSSDTAPLS